MTTFPWLAVAIQIAIALFVVAWSWRLGKKIADLRLLKLQMDPPPPVNIQLHLHDGSKIPVDAVLSPTRIWRVQIPKDLDPATLNGVGADKLPPFTEITFERQR